MIRIVWQECNLVFAIMGESYHPPYRGMPPTLPRTGCVDSAPAIMCAKWASTGLTSQYDQAMLGLVVAGQAYFGWRYTQIGLYSPLAALALAPGLTIASQFV